MIDEVKASVARGIAKIHQRLWLTRAMTLGVRMVVLDGDRVFLVRHTYVPGWYLPGGGVDRGESAEQAGIRELREEGGLVCTERPALHGLFRNGRHDHVACFVARAFAVGPIAPGTYREIAEAGFFPLDRLPEGTTPATRARLMEVLEGTPVAESW